MEAAFQSKKGTIYLTMKPALGSGSEGFFII